MEYLILCDESVKKGRYYSNFYGGVLVSSKDLDVIVKTIRKICIKHRLNDELKWQNVTAQYLNKYIAVIDVFFMLMAKGKIKARITFRQNAHRPTNLSKSHHDNEFFLLYYQFIKHAFGLEYSNKRPEPIHIRIYFDNLPDTIAKCQQFKEYIKGLETSRKFQLARVKIRKEDISEVRSHNHILLQCLDIVLGSMAFRLNDMHKEKPEGSRLRGKRTIAKEKLFKHISTHIRSIYPGFNIGVSTGRDEESDNWNHQYRHWSFRPKDFKTDETAYK
jgi:hypothetical protein